MVLRLTHSMPADMPSDGVPDKEVPDFFQSTFTLNVFAWKIAIEKAIIYYCIERGNMMCMKWSCMKSGTGKNSIC